MSLESDGYGRRGADREGLCGCIAPTRSIGAPRQDPDRLARQEEEEEEGGRREGPYLEGIRTRQTQISRVGTRTALQRSLTQKDLKAQFDQALVA
jgi:hypothetical protein